MKSLMLSKILEGRLAIIVNNSPIVLTLFILIEDIQNSNDYYSQNYYASYIRIIRIIGIIIATLLPGLYLLLRVYHYNVMPLNFNDDWEFFRVHSFYAIFRNVVYISFV